MIVNMIKFFWYKHPKTKEMFSDQRMIGYEEKPLVIKGVKCEIVKDYTPPEKEYKPLGPIRVYKDGQREVFQADPQYVKKMSPKYIKFNDGHREIYDSTKHC